MGLQNYASVSFCAESGLFLNHVGDMPLHALSLNDATRFFNVKGEILKEVEVTLIIESSVVNKVG